MAVVTLITREGDSRTVPVEIALYSRLVRNALVEEDEDEDEGEPMGDETVPIKVSVETLDLVLEFLVHHHADPVMYPPDEIDVKSIHETLDEWCVQFTTKLSPTQLLDLADKSEVLDIPILARVACTAIWHLSSDIDAICGYDGEASKKDTEEPMRWGIAKHETIIADFFANGPRMKKRDDDQFPLSDDIVQKVMKVKPESESESESEEE